MQKEAVELLKAVCEHEDAENGVSYRLSRKGETAQSQEKLAQVLIEEGYAQRGFVIHALISTPKGRGYISEKPAG